VGGVAVYLHQAVGMQVQLEDIDRVAFEQADVEHLWGEHGEATL
jgi:hypothetical protein